MLSERSPHVCSWGCRAVMNVARSDGMAVDPTWKNGFFFGLLPSSKRSHQLNSLLRAPLLSLLHPAPLVHGSGKRYVATTHPLCSETSVFRENCVFNTTPEVRHHAADPFLGGVQNNMFFDVFLGPSGEALKIILLRAKTRLGANLYFSGPQLDPQNGPKIEILGGPRGYLS